MVTRVDFRFQFRNRKYYDIRRGMIALAEELEKDWQSSAKVLSKELKSFLQGVVRELAERHSTPWPSGTTDDTLSKRSGRLVNSIRRSVRIKGNTLSTLQGYISIGNPALVHEFGATIRPKRAKFLTVPLPPALDMNGRPKKRRARDWDNTFVTRTRAGNLVIFQRRGSQIIPLYVLKSSVTIKPRLGLRSTLEKSVPRFVERAADKMVRHIRVR